MEKFSRVPPHIYNPECRRFLSRCAVLVVVLCIAYLISDLFFERFLVSQKTNSPASQPAKSPANPPVSTPENLAETQAAEPKAALTPAQVEFWNYLEQFNRLPDNPTEQMVAVYNTKGIPPEFHTIKESDTSAIGDIEGLTTHRELFPKRYPWVQPLLDQYEIEIPISAERFSGSAHADAHVIAKSYERLMSVSHKCDDTPENEKIFVTNYLEGLLVVDFIYSSGSATDKQQSQRIIDGIFRVNLVWHPFRSKLEASLIKPATKQIGWAVYGDYPEFMEGMGPAVIFGGFLRENHADKVNFLKWMMTTKGIPKVETEYHQKIHQDLIHNELVNAGLLSYSIYKLHTYERVRPKDSPGMVVIKILFKRLFPKDHAAEYQRYLSLLDAAYPKTTI